MDCRMGSNKLDISSAMKAQPKRPPADRGQGRKSLAGEGASPVIRIRGSQALADKVKRNGAAWARDVLERAPDKLG